MPHIKDIISSYGPATKYSSDHNQCAVTALSASFEIPYDVAHSAAQVHWNRKNRSGTKMNYILKTLGNGEFLGRKVWQVPVRRAYWSPNGIGKRMRRMKVKSFAKHYSDGTYYILVSTHALVVKNGTIIDNRHDGANRNVNYAWKII